MKWNVTIWVELMHEMQYTCKNKMKNIQIQHCRNSFKI